MICHSRIKWFSGLHANGKSIAISLNLRTTWLQNSKNSFLFHIYDKIVSYIFYSINR